MPSPSKYQAVLYSFELSVKFLLLFFSQPFLEFDSTE